MWPAFGAFQPINLPSANGHSEAPRPNEPYKPIRRARERLLLSERPNLERNLLSLDLKTATQGVIVASMQCQGRPIGDPRSRDSQYRWPASSPALRN